MEVLVVRLQNPVMLAYAVLVASKAVPPAPILAYMFARSSQGRRRGRCVGFSQQSREDESGRDHEKSRCSGHFRLGGRFAVGV